MPVDQFVVVLLQVLARHRGRSCLFALRRPHGYFIRLVERLKYSWLEVSADHMT